MKIIQIVQNWKLHILCESKIPQNGNNELFYENEDVFRFAPAT